MTAHKNRSQALCLVVASCIAAMTLGCGDDGANLPPPSATDAAPVSSAPVPPPPPAPNLSQAIAASGNQAAAELVREPEEEMEREKAEVGAGKQGRNYGGGIITEPVRAYFRTGQLVVFNIQIPNALKTYKALNDGQGPPDHETFMQDIIQENSIGLPELPDGQSYFYDAEREELMVQRPRR